MLSAALLRKEILSVLQEQVIPDLLSGGVRRLVTARLPLKAPAGVTVREMEHPPLKEEDAQRMGRASEVVLLRIDVLNIEFDDGIVDLFGFGKTNV